MTEAGAVRGDPRTSTPEAMLEPFAHRAARLARAPIALVTFIDDAHRRWVKVAVGLERDEAARHAAFGAWAVHNAEVLCTEDAAADPRLSDNPLVLEAPPIRHYAAAPIVSEGRQLGAICIFDPAPRPVDPQVPAALLTLAGEVSSALQASIHPDAP